MRAALQQSKAAGHGENPVESLCVCVFDRRIGHIEAGSANMQGLRRCCLQDFSLRSNLPLKNDPSRGVIYIYICTTKHVYMLGTKKFIHAL